MSVTVPQQLHALAGAVLLGVVCGGWYDLLRGLRRRTASPVWTAVLDLLFWLAATAGLFLWCIRAGNGRVQLVLCLAVAVGGWGYFRWLSGLCFPALSALAGLLLLPCFSLKKLKKFFIKICKKHFSFGNK